MRLRSRGRNWSLRRWSWRELWVTPRLPWRARRTRSIHEIEKQRKKLESEKMELEGALGDAETALEAEENKFLRMSLEINQVKAEIEKRLQEKDEEFESTRRNHTKAMEQMQFAIEQESKSKAEAVRIKKKLEPDIGELDSALDHANLSNAELQKNIKLCQ